MVMPDVFIVPADFVKDTSEHLQEGTAEVPTDYLV